MKCHHVRCGMTPGIMKLRITDDEMSFLHNGAAYVPFLGITAICHVPHDCRMNVIMILSSPSKHATRRCANTS